jgi:glucose/arabinose dehydrogenase
MVSKSAIGLGAAGILASLLPALEAAQVPAGFQDRRLIAGLDQPTACEFAPDGRLFILLKEGRVRVFRDDALVPEPALTLSVNPRGERGLLGIAFDPKFERNHFVYLYYTTPNAQPTNRVSRFVIDGDRIDPGSERLVIGGIRSYAGNHNAGCLRFGPDGQLYVAIGDGGESPELAQDLESLNGKILRIKPRGGIPRDNPFVGQSGRRGEIWCFGLRNPWRFRFDLLDGTLFIADVGEGPDEINLGAAGANYGWPTVEGSVNRPGFVDPIYEYSFGNAGNAVVGGVVYRGSAFPAEYRGVYFFGDYVQGLIRYLVLSEDHTVEQVRDFASDVGDIVHLIDGPDGALYYATISGQIRSIRYRGR